MGTQEHITSKWPSLSHMVVVLAVALTSGCGVTRNAIPVEHVFDAEPVAVQGIRDWGGVPSDLFQRDIVESARQARTAGMQNLIDDEGYVNVLALSGGGASGAYGAGMLAGWTDSGKRPRFKLVTGVSTGALIAPFAFLGPKYDPVLKKFYTSLKTEDVVKPRSSLEILGGTHSLMDSAPLGKLIEETLTPEIFREIAEEHRKGRRLYVLTTNLDAGKAVVWNMGAIAAEGTDEALALFRQVMRGSASIPVAMPPQFIPVRAGGKVYDEMHVDGGVSAQVFFYGFMINLEQAIAQAGIAQKPKSRIYIVRNGQLGMEPESVKPRMLPIAGRAILGLLNTQGLGDLYRIYTITQRDGIDFNLAYIPDDFVPKGKEMFDPEEMQRLYQLGYDMAKAGYKWNKTPPGMTRPAGLTRSPSGSQ